MYKPEVVLLAVAEFLGGLLLLVLGGEVLVRGAVRIARLAGLSAAVIGLTVVAAGTSLPELVVAVLAALRGEPDLAVGNVFGSNIFNVTLALGLTALISPLPVHGTAIRLEWPVMFGASAACALLMRDALVDRPEAAFLLLCLVLFIAFSVHLAREDVTARERAGFEKQAAERTLVPRGPLGWYAAGAVLLGVLLLVAGGHLLVEGAVQFARLAGLSERVIGLTVVALGTGMPELATSLVAAVRGQADMAVANMIGSNVMNLLGILGATALISPIHVSAGLLSTDLWWMVGTSALLLPILRHGTIARWGGGVLVVVYLTYIATLFQ